MVLGSNKMATVCTDKELFDSSSRFWMGVSGDEFLRRLDDGQYRELHMKNTNVKRMENLLHLVSR